MSKKKCLIFLIILIMIVKVFGLTVYSTDVDDELQDNIAEEPSNNNETSQETNDSEEISPQEEPTSNIPEPSSEANTWTTPNSSSSQVEERVNSQSSRREEGDNIEQSTQINGTIPEDSFASTEVKANNNNLKSIEIEGKELEPAFEKNITEYYLVVDLDVDELEVVATAEHVKSTVEITGNTDLVEGENIITIIVTAENGDTKEYKILVTKTDNIDATNANLKNLEVNGFNIFPSFSSKIYNYNLTINKIIKELKITAEAQDEKANIEITGNENLKEGENTISIIVTAQDGITKRTYILNTFISTANVQVTEENKMPAMYAIGILLIIILILGMYLLNRKNYMR